MAETDVKADPARSASEELRELRIGVVGAGARAPLALRAEKVDPAARVTMAADPHRLGAERVAKRLGDHVRHVASHREMIGHIDAAVITSPDDTHRAIACDLLRAGIPVYVEKPLAITIEGADEILQAAYSSGTKLYVGHNMRHMSVIRIMKKLIDDGEIGPVRAIWCRHFVGHGGDYYFKDWHAERAHGTGLLLQKGAHDIDVMHWLAGSYTRQVTAMGDQAVYTRVADRRERGDELLGDFFSYDNWPPLAQQGLNPRADVEDISMVLGRLESGAFMSYQQCHFTPDYWRNYTIIGEEGRIENFGDSEGGTVRLWRGRSDWRPEGDLNIPIVGDAGGHDDADNLTMAEFLTFIRRGTPTDTSPLAAREAVATGHLATVSLRNGSQPQQVPAPKPEIATYFRGGQQSRP